MSSSSSSTEGFREQLVRSLTLHARKEATNQICIIESDANDKDVALVKDLLRHLEEFVRSWDKNGADCDKRVRAVASTTGHLLGGKHGPDLEQYLVERHKLLSPAQIVCRMEDDGEINDLGLLSRLEGLLSRHSPTPSPRPIASALPPTPSSVKTTHPSKRPRGGDANGARSKSADGSGDSPVTIDDRATPTPSRASPGEVALLPDDSSDPEPANKRQRTTAPPRDSLGDSIASPSRSSSLQASLPSPPPPPPPAPEADNGRLNPHAALAVSSPTTARFSSISSVLNHPAAAPMGRPAGAKDSITMSERSSSTSSPSRSMKSPAAPASRAAQKA